MRGEQRRDDRLDAVARDDGLDAQLRRSLLLARGADGRLGPFAAEERAGVPERGNKESCLAGLLRSG